MSCSSCVFFCVHSVLRAITTSQVFCSCWHIFIPLLNMITLFGIPSVFLSLVLSYLPQFAAVVMKDLTCTEQNNPNKKWSLAKNPPKPPESMLLCWGLDFDLPVLIFFFFSVCSFHLPSCGPTEATSFVPEFCFLVIFLTGIWDSFKCFFFFLSKTTFAFLWNPAELHSWPLCLSYIHFKDHWELSVPRERWPSGPLREEAGSLSATAHPIHWSVRLPTRGGTLHLQLQSRVMFVLFKPCFFFFLSPCEPSYAPPLPP